MADLAIAVASNLIEVLGSKAIQEVFQMWNYKSQLVELKNRVSFIQKVLLDADAKRELTNQEQEYITMLKDVVYDADDLFDEIRTLSELNQLTPLNKVDKIIAKVRSNFSSRNPMVQAYKRSCKVKDLKSRLDSIADNHTKFGFSVDYKPIVKRREETCSYVNVKDIIGRDKDKKIIIDKLLDPCGNEDVCFLTIVGVGGLGKTALAQLVINDAKIRKEFPFRYWVCVSDQEGVEFDVKTILLKILEVVTKTTVAISSSFEVVQDLFQEQLRGKKYLLILDDVWNENHHVLQKFRSFLTSDVRGSRILITTRSEKTASNIRSLHVYKLKALSKEDSRHLFELCAFGDREKNTKLVEIGQKIVEKCHRTPLAIKVVGSLLYGQDISKWKSIENSGLGGIYEGSDKILPILKLSYHNLTPSLKSCFSYCSIYPKDFRMNKNRLMSLWMAQGYIVPLDEGQSVEDAVEEYFSILMRRCFFQDVKIDSYGNVESVKLHDLMHDVAQEVGKEEISVITSRESNLGEIVRHVNIVDGECENTLLLKNKIRSYICDNWRTCLVDKQVQNLISLRVLELSNFFLNTSLPSNIGSLLLLRYLRVSDYQLKKLPESITKLCNLETLVLNCTKLKELPKDLSNLVKLRHLDVMGCNELIGMPIGIDRLTKLRVLPYFVVGENLDNELKALQFLTELRGEMEIKLRNKNIKVNDEGRWYLERKHLPRLTIFFESSGTCANNPRVVLENLEPPLNLMRLYLSDYKGTTLPWLAFSPKHFVHIDIQNCYKLERIFVLSTLPYLKSLKIVELVSVEYMEDEMNNNNNHVKAVSEYFPSLESLEIMNMSKMEGWWKGELLGKRLRFPRLSSIEIFNCPKFISFAPCSCPQSLVTLELPSLCSLKIQKCCGLSTNLICPNLEYLELAKFSENLQLTCAESQDDVFKLKYVKTDRLAYLNLLPINFLITLEVDCDEKVQRLSEVKEGFQRCASTLRTLEIVGCKNLSTLSGLEQFTALEVLKLQSNNKFIVREKDEEPWKSLQTIRKLEFSLLYGMKGLPRGLQNLTSLNSLSLSWLCNFKSLLPEWIGCLSTLQILQIHFIGIKSLPESIKDLTALKEVTISGNSELKKRCENPNGEDFPKIKHIPQFNFIVK